jgi:hypothetical protein
MRLQSDPITAFSKSIADGALKSRSTIRRHAGLKVSRTIAQ